MRNLFNFLWRNHFFLLFLLLEVVAFILLVNSQNYHKSLAVNSSNRIFGGLNKVTSGINSYFSLKKQNEKLQLENARLNESSSYAYLIGDQKEYMKHDSLFRQQYIFMSARVVNNSTMRQNNYVTLDKGWNSGVSKEMAVISPDGVVGIVRQVTANYSSVISVLNSQTKISARIPRNNSIGTVAWDGVDYSYGQLQDIPTHFSLEKGDTIVTSGYSSIFPKGIMIGTIESFEENKVDNFYRIKMRFSCDLNSVDHVYIVKNLFQHEMKALEPDENE